MRYEKGGACNGSNNNEYRQALAMALRLKFELESLGLLKANRSRSDFRRLILMIRNREPMANIADALAPFVLAYWKHCESRKQYDP